MRCNVTRTARTGGRATAKLVRRQLAAFTEQVLVRYGDFTPLARPMLVEGPFPPRLPVADIGVAMPPQFSKS